MSDKDSEKLNELTKTYIYQKQAAIADPSTEEIAKLAEEVEAKQVQRKTEILRLTKDFYIHWVSENGPGGDCHYLFQSALNAALAWYEKSDEFYEK